MMRIRVALGLAVLALGGCGARSGLVSGGGGDTTDAGTDDGDAGVIASCEVYWEACTARTDAIVVSEGMGQAPDIAWDGHELLVVYDDAGANTLAHVSLDGVVAARVQLRGIQAPRVTWNPLLGAGVVVVDSGVQWLGRDGWPVGDYVPAALEGSQLAGDVSATADGFLLLTGAVAYGTPPSLYYAVLGAEPGDVSFEGLAEGGPRAPAGHANGADGLARWAVSTAYYVDVGEVYRLDGALDPPERVVELAGALPLGGEGYGASIAERDGRLYVLYDGAPPPGGGWTEWILEVDPVAGGVRTWQVDRSANGGAGELLAFGDVLVVASPAIHPQHVVSLGTFEPDADPPVGVLLELASPAAFVSHSPRLTPTPTGLAVVWNESSDSTEGLSAMLQVFDCCARE